MTNLGGPPGTGVGYADVPVRRPQKTEAVAGGEDDDKKEKAEGTPTPTPAPTGTKAPAGPPPPPPPPPVVRTPLPAISWAAPSETVTNAGGSSTTIEKAFTVSYTADKDTSANVWHMGVSAIGGGTTTELHTGGSRDPTTSPPTTEDEAKKAVTEMKEYYKGGRGSWHTVGATRAHEGHHNREWNCSGDHYWASAGPAIAALTAPLASNADSAAAVAAMKPAADAKIASFKSAAKTYWNTLDDTVGSRPYAAGQAVLNGEITAVQALAATKHWTVEAGTTATTGTEPPCYLPYAAYTP